MPMPAAMVDCPAGADLDAADLALLDCWQHDFPLAERPFAQIGAAVGLSETRVIARYADLLSVGLISRIGAIVAPNTVGASTLAAVAAAPGEVDRIARLINEDPGVNHNYEREHAINLWFVATADDETELEAALGRLEQQLDRPVRDLRLERPHHLDLGFSISEPGAARRDFRSADATKLELGDRELLSALAEGLPIAARPFAGIGDRAEMTEAQVIRRLTALSDAQIIRRFGVVLKHRQLGFTANAMVVFDIPRRDVDDVGEQLARMPGVTLCYRRRRAFDWRYNLYCMVHARSRAEADPVIVDLRDAAAAASRDMAVLYSTRCFRQRGARFGVAWTWKGRPVMATPHLKESKVSVIAMDDWSIVKSTDTQGPGFFMRSHPNSRYAWTDVFFGPTKDVMHVIDKETLEIAATIQPAPGKTAAHVEFDREGRYALVSIWEDDGALIVYDAATLKEVKRLPMHKPSGKYNVWNKITFAEGTSH